MKKRLIVLLAGMLTMGAVSFAELGSVKHEFKFLDEKDGAEAIEWTLAKGKVNVLDNSTFYFDVDRDISLDDGAKTADGWDTAYGMNFKVGTFEAAGYEWQYNQFVGFEWDQVDEVTTKELYYVAPRIATQFTETLAFQLDPRMSYNNLTDDYYMDLRFQFGADLGYGWDNSLEIYNEIGKGGEAYSMDIENYLGYTKQLVGPLYFWTEFGVEAYGMMNEDLDTSVTTYANPQLQVATEIAGVSVEPYIGYYLEDTGYKEFEAGIAFSTSF